MYRRQVKRSGSKLALNEDGPIHALDVAHMTMAYKRNHTAVWTDSDSDCYRKHDDSDSDGDGLVRPSKGNTT